MMHVGHDTDNDSDSLTLQVHATTDPRDGYVHLDTTPLPVLARARNKKGVEGKVEPLFQAATQQAMQASYMQILRQGGDAKTRTRAVMETWFGLMVCAAIHERGNRLFLADPSVYRSTEDAHEDAIMYTDVKSQRNQEDSAYAKQRQRYWATPLARGNTDNEAFVNEVRDSNMGFRQAFRIKMEMEANVYLPPQIADTETAIFQDTIAALSLGESVTYQHVEAFMRPVPRHVLAQQQTKDTLDHLLNTGDMHALETDGVVKKHVKNLHETWRAVVKTWGLLDRGDEDTEGPYSASDISTYFKPHTDVKVMRFIVLQGHRFLQLMAESRLAVKLLPYVDINVLDIIDMKQSALKEYLELTGQMSPEEKELLITVLKVHAEEDVLILQLIDERISQVVETDSKRQLQALRSTVAVRGKTAAKLAKSLETAKATGVDLDRDDEKLWPAYATTPARKRALVRLGYEALNAWYDHEEEELEATISVSQLAKQMRAKMEVRLRQEEKDKMYHSLYLKSLPEALKQLQETSRVQQRVAVMTAGEDEDTTEVVEDWKARMEEAAEDMATASAKTHISLKQTQEEIEARVAKRLSRIDFVKRAKLRLNPYAVDNDDIDEQKTTLVDVMTTEEDVASRAEQLRTAAAARTRAALAKTHPDEEDLNRKVEEALQAQDFKQEAEAALEAEAAAADAAVDAEAHSTVSQAHRQELALKLATVSALMSQCPTENVLRTAAALKQALHERVQVGELRTTGLEVLFVHKKEAQKRLNEDPALEAALHMHLADVAASQLGSTENPLRTTNARPMFDTSPALNFYHFQAQADISDQLRNQTFALYAELLDSAHQKWTPPGSEPSTSHAGSAAASAANQSGSSAGSGVSQHEDEDEDDIDPDLYMDDDDQDDEKEVENPFLNRVKKQGLWGGFFDDIERIHRENRAERKQDPNAKRTAQPTSPVPRNLVLHTTLRYMEWQTAWNMAITELCFQSYVHENHAAQFAFPLHANIHTSVPFLYQEADGQIDLVTNIPLPTVDATYELVVVQPTAKKGQPKPHPYVQKQLVVKAHSYNEITAPHNLLAKLIQYSTSRSLKHIQIRAPTASRVRAHRLCPGGDACQCAKALEQLVITNKRICGQLAHSTAGVQSEASRLSSEEWEAMANQYIEWLTQAMGRTHTGTIRRHLFTSRDKQHEKLKPAMSAVEWNVLALKGALKKGTVVTYPWNRTLVQHFLQFVQWHLLHSASKETELSLIRRGYLKTRLLSLSPLFMRKEKPTNVDDGNNSTVFSDYGDVDYATAAISGDTTSKRLSASLEVLDKRFGHDVAADSTLQQLATTQGSIDLAQATAEMDAFLSDGPSMLAEQVWKTSTLTTAQQWQHGAALGNVGTLDLQCATQLLTAIQSDVVNTKSDLQDLMDRRGFKSDNRDILARENATKLRTFVTDLQTHMHATAQLDRDLQMEDTLWRGDYAQRDTNTETLLARLMNKAQVTRGLTSDLRRTLLNNTDPLIQVARPNFRNHEIFPTSTIRPELSHFNTATAEVLRLVQRLSDNTKLNPLVTQDSYNRNKQETVTITPNMRTLLVERIRAEASSIQRELHYIRYQRRDDKVLESTRIVLYRLQRLLSVVHFMRLWPLDSEVTTSEQYQFFLQADEHSWNLKNQEKVELHLNAAQALVHAVQEMDPSTAVSTNLQLPAYTGV